MNQNFIDKLLLELPDESTLYIDAGVHILN